jgi:hypothetical protein
MGFVENFWGTPNYYLGVTFIGVISGAVNRGFNMPLFVTIGINMKIV